MRGRLKGMLLAGALAAVVALPGSGQASHGAHSADCEGTVAPGATATCTSTWVDDQPGYVSQIETHGNFHELLATGEVTLEWIDAVGNSVVKSTCLSPGLALEIESANPDQSSFIGPFDLQSFTCTSTYNSTGTYVEGLQTLLVTAAVEDCGAEACKFHGHIEISPPTALF